MQETPENCFYDLMTAHRELLTGCGFALPERRSLEETLQKGPECLFLYHPTLGPLYSIIRKKLSGGILRLGAEFLLEMADVLIHNLHVQGSLQIMGKESGRCILENVTIENRGVDWSRSKPYWKMDLKRDESVKIVLKGDGRFIARNAHLSGSRTFIVEEGQTMEI